MTEPVQNSSRYLRLLALLSAAALSCAALFGLTALFSADAGASPLWRPLLRLHDRAAVAMGSDAIGDIYLAEERMLRRTQHYDSTVIAENTEALNAFAAGTDTPVYFIAAPTAALIYADAFSENAPRADEQAMLRTAAEQLSPRITQIDVISRLSSVREEPIYYRTDSRMTAFGAYTVYKAAARRLGYEAVGYDRITISHYDTEYYGNLAQSARYFAYSPDMIDLYACDGTAFTVAACRPDGNAVLPSYYLPDRAETAEDPCAVFGIISEPVLRLEADRAGRNLLLLCDESCAGILPLFMQNYRSVTAVNLPAAAEQGLDWRALAGEPESGYAQILILLSAESIASQRLAGVIDPNQAS